MMGGSQLSRVFVLFALALALSASAAADDGPLLLSRKEDLDARPMHPPEEAYDACSGKDDNQSCSVRIYEKTIDGTCVPELESDVLFCLPDDVPSP